MKYSQKILIITILSAFQYLASAQTTIKGRVTDKKNGIAGVSISLKDTYDGATSDSAGHYSFTTTEKGEFVLTASAIGYKPFEQMVKLEPGTLTIDILLKEEITELTAVTVTAGTFEASDKKKVTVLGPIDIVTTASGNGDITEALKSLPGAQQIGESEGLFVRGGTAGETKIFIDGTLVNNFFYTGSPNIASRGRFSPFLFKGTVFSTGGYSALYGQALSSALILESIDLPEQSSANLGVSVIGLSGGFQQLAKNKKSSWGIDYGYTDLSLAFALIKQRQDYFKVPILHNADANFRIKTSKTGILKYYSTFGSQKLGFRTNSLDTLTYKDIFRLKNINMYHNLSWKEKIANKWRLETGVSYTNNRDQLAGGLQDADNTNTVVSGLEFKNYALDLKGHYFNAKMVVEKRFTGLSVLRFGGEYNFSDDHSMYTAYDNSRYPGLIRENLGAAFAETDIYLTNAIAAKIGGRYEHSSLFQKSNIAPRLSLAYKTGKTSQASVAYGIFYQNPERRYLPATAPLTFMKATHYIAQYQLVSKDYTLRGEIFYKRYNDLIKTASNGTAESASSNNGFGDARGFDFFWRDKKTLKNVDYWISYSYLDTKRDYLNFPYAIQPSFAAKHTASLIIKKFVSQWKTGFNAAYNFATGRPYYYIGYDGATSSYQFKDRGKTPAYQNFSFSLNYLPNLNNTNAKKFTVLVLSVSNVFGFDQTYGYQYSFDGMRKQRIVPPSKTFVFIGMFISFGVDRSDDVINMNL
ncbi:MAG: TonB-dependent receptor plug domain-containing protein [Terrimonas sp.]|nr:TonB-dependent receptor plug domain-containing protein [Terrimonas sp.]